MHSTGDDHGQASRPSAATVAPTGPSSRSFGQRWGGDIRAGLAVAVGCLLLGAPVGLLWAAVTPRVEVAVTAAGPQVVDVATKDFIAADGAFLAVVLVVGAITGLLAWLSVRTRVVGMVLGLLAGGLLAAEIARRTGQLVGAQAARDAVAAGQEGVVELAARLRSLPVLVGWPVGGLLAVALASLLFADEPPPPDPLSSG